jgi:hypothetical protein
MNALLGAVGGFGASYGYWMVHKANNEWETGFGMGLLAASATLILVVARLRCSAGQSTGVGSYAGQISKDVALGTAESQKHLEKAE